MEISHESPLIGCLSSSTSVYATPLCSVSSLGGEEGQWLALLLSRRALFFLFLFFIVPQLGLLPLLPSGFGARVGAGLRAPVPHPLRSVSVSRSSRLCVRGSVKRRWVPVSAFSSHSTSALPPTLPLPSSSPFARRLHQTRHLRRSAGVETGGSQEPDRVCGQATLGQIRHVSPSPRILCHSKDLKQSIKSKHL